MNVPKIAIGPIVRFLFLAVGLVNQVLVTFGLPIIPIESAQVENVLASGILIISALWAYWKDNDITIKARLRKYFGKQSLDVMKEEEKHELENEKY